MLANLDKGKDKKAQTEKKLRIHSTSAGIDQTKKIASVQCDKGGEQVEKMAKDMPRLNQSLRTGRMPEGAPLRLEKGEEKEVEPSEKQKRRRSHSVSIHEKKERALVKTADEDEKDDGVEKELLMCSKTRQDQERQRRKMLFGARV